MLTVSGTVMSAIGVSSPSTLADTRTRTLSDVSVAALSAVSVSTVLRLKKVASLICPRYRFTRPGRACRVTALPIRLIAEIDPSARATSA
ncbi:MAG TPA: hypothetical protein DCX91_14760 [Stenotrophomonas sp.]|nr:hypothetical protein [Stenotrophomonas sp.]